MFAKAKLACAAARSAKEAVPSARPSYTIVFCHLVSVPVVLRTVLLTKLCVLMLNLGLFLTVFFENETKATTVGKKTMS